jgi:ABC-type multidrug transport system ATPase subunit
LTRAVFVSGLRVLDVSKSFPSSRGPRPVLKNISFHVPPGGLVCLLGPNGSGKTTLLKTIGTLLLPDGGRVLLDEVDVHRASVRAKEKIGFASTEDQTRPQRSSGGHRWRPADLRRSGGLRSNRRRHGRGRT